MDLIVETIRSTFQSVMGSSLSQKSAVETISQWQSKPSHELIFDSGSDKIRQYMQAVDRLQQSPNVKGSNDKLISTAIGRLRNEFVAVLSRQAYYHAGPISTTESSVCDSTANAIRYEDYAISEPPSEDVVTYLRNIAERMNSSGKLGECIKVYKSVRKSFLQSQQKQLHFDELRGGNNTRSHMPDDLKVKMELWIQVSKICVKILFEREKKLCDQIFQGLGDGAAKDECFVGTVKEFAVGLFGFAEQVSSSKQPYDKMGNVLGVYDAFLWVLPSADALFLSDQGKGIRDSGAQTLTRIKEDVGRMLYDFQNAVLHEILDVFDDRGAVDRSTEHVMEQINLIVRNKRLLTSLIKSAPLMNFGDMIIPQEALGDYSYNRSFLELHLILIIEVLQKNLETKSKSYKDSSLGQLFMMNNVRYIVRKIEGSNELKEMIGDQYLTKLNENLISAMASYESSTCSKFLTCFEDKGLYITRCFKSRPSKTAIKRRLNHFNAVFEEIKAVHSFWTIPDSQLRDEVRVSMSEILVPAYKDFLEKFGSNPETKLLLEKNIKHSIEDLEALVLKKLFNEVYL